MQISLNLLHNLAQSKARLFPLLAGRSFCMGRGPVHDVLCCDLVLGRPGQGAIPHPTPFAMSPSLWPGIPSPAALGDPSWGLLSPCSSGGSLGAGSGCLCLQPVLAQGHSAPAHSSMHHCAILPCPGTNLDWKSGVCL